MKKTKLVSLILSAAMLLSLVTVPAAAAEEDTPVTTSLEEVTPEVAAPTPVDFPDMKDHWGAAAVDRWSGVGVLRGDQFGNFRPNDRMTRGEFATMLVNLMGYTVKAENIYADVAADAWYADAILKVTAAGVMQGDGTNANPEAPITRQEAAVMLCRALNLKPTDKASTGFVDADDIADWAKGAVAALASRGMVQGMGNNDFLPTHDINRASVAQMVSNMVSSYVTVDGATVTGEQKGLVIVAADDVKIEDATLAEALIVAPKAVDSTVTLAGETTAADVVVAAEGAKVVVEKDASAASIALNAPKAAAEVAGKADLVAANADEVAVTVAKDAEVKDVNVNGEGADVTVAGKVDNVTVAETAKDTDITVEQGATVDKVENNAEGTSIDGKGKIDNLATDKDVELAKDTTVAKIENTGDEAVKVGDKEVKPDASESNTPANTSSSSGGVSGGSSTSYKYKVSVASVTGGKVTASVTQTNDAGEVTLTVTPDAQKGSTMPYVLKSLSVKCGDGDAQNITSEKKFTLAEEGTYTVTAEFVQPITKAVMYVANGTDKTAADMVADGYYEDDYVPDETLKQYPYFFVGMTKNDDVDKADYPISEFKITANGKDVELPNGWGTPSSIFTFASAYVGNTKPEIDPHENADKLNFTGSACTFVLTFKIKEAEYKFSWDYVKPGVNVEDLKTITFKTNTNETIASYKGAAEETVKVPAHPELEGYYFTGWDKEVTEGTEYAIGEGGDVTANYLKVTTQTVAQRPAGDELDYAAAYTKAGVSGTTTIKVDGAKMIVKENVADGICHDFGGVYAFYGLQFTKTGDAADATSVKVAKTVAELDGKTAIYLTTNSVSDDGDVLEGQFIDYFAVGKVEGDKVTLMNDTIFKRAFMWMKDDEILAVTQVEIKRETTVPTFKVTFEGATVAAQTVELNGKVTKPADPTKANAEFDGWYVGTEKFDFDTPITKDTTITAKWIDVVTLTVTPYDYSCNLVNGNYVQYITYTLKNGNEKFYIATDTVEKCEFRYDRKADGAWTVDDGVELFDDSVNGDFTNKDKEHQLGWTVSRRDTDSTAYWRFTGKDGKIYVATFTVPAKIDNGEATWGDTLVDSLDDVKTAPKAPVTDPDEVVEEPGENPEENLEEGEGGEKTPGEDEGQDTEA